MIEGFIKVTILRQHEEEDVMKGFPKYVKEKGYIRISDIVGFQTYKRDFEDGYKCESFIACKDRDILVYDTIQYIEKELSKPTKFNNINN